MSEPGGAVLTMRQVVRTYGSNDLEVHALAGIDLDVAAGELIAIMGPSGSGKTSLLSIAGGLDSPTSGDVLVNGESLTSKKPKDLAALRRRSIGYVFQQLNLTPSTWFASMPGGLKWSDVLRLNDQGVKVVSRAVLLNPPPRSEVPFYQKWGSQAPSTKSVATGIAVGVAMALLQLALLAGRRSPSAPAAAAMTWR